MKLSDQSRDNREGDHMQINLFSSLIARVLRTYVKAMEQWMENIEQSTYRHWIVWILFYFI